MPLQQALAGLGAELSALQGLTLDLERHVHDALSGCARGQTTSAPQKLQDFDLLAQSLQALAAYVDAMKAGVDAQDTVDIQPALNAVHLADLQARLRMGQAGETPRMAKDAECRIELF